MFGTVLGGVEDAEERRVEGLFVPPGIQHLGLAFGQRSCFIKDDGIDMAQVLQGRSVADKNVLLRALADTHHQSRRRRQSQCTRASNHQDRNRREQSVREHRRPAHDQPHDKRQQRDADHHGDEDGTDFIDDALHRSLTALRLLHAADDLRQYGCLAYIRRFHLEGTRLVNRTCQDAVADVLFDRKRFAGQHTLVHGRNALRDKAIDRNLFARTDNHDIANTEESDWDIFLEAVLQLVSSLGLQVHQAADGRRGALLGTSLQQFAQQDERDNHA